MARKPWYVSTEQWLERDEIPPGADGITTHEVHLSNVLRSMPTEDERQTALLIELVHEVHVVKWVLILVAVIVPAIMLILGILLVTAAHAPAVSPSDSFGGF